MTKKTIERKAACGRSTEAMVHRIRSDSVGNAGRAPQLLSCCRAQGNRGMLLSGLARDLLKTSKPRKHTCWKCAIQTRWRCTRSRGSGWFQEAMHGALVGKLDWRAGDRACSSSEPVDQVVLTGAAWQVVPAGRWPALSPERERARVHHGKASGSPRWSEAIQYGRDADDPVRFLASGVRAAFGACESWLSARSRPS